MNPDTFYGVVSDGNGEGPLSYYLYPPPALNSVGTNDTGEITCTTPQGSSASLHPGAGFLCLAPLRGLSATSYTIQKNTNNVNACQLMMG